MPEEKYIKLIELAERGGKDAELYLLDLINELQEKINEMGKMHEEFQSKVGEDMEAVNENIEWNKLREEIDSKMENILGLHQILLEKKAEEGHDTHKEMMMGLIEGLSKSLNEIKDKPQFKLPQEFAVNGEVGIKKPDWFSFPDIAGILSNALEKLKSFIFKAKLEKGDPENRQYVVLTDDEGNIINLKDLADSLSSEGDNKNAIRSGGVSVSRPSFLITNDLDNVNTTYNDVTTAANSQTIDCSRYRNFCLFFTLVSAEVSTQEIVIKVQFSADGTTWLDYRNNFWGQMLWDDTATATAVNYAFNGECTAPFMRIRAVASNTTSANTFTLSNCRVSLKT